MGTVGKSNGDGEAAASFFTEAEKDMASFEATGKEELSFGVALFGLENFVDDAFG